MRVWSYLFLTVLIFCEVMLVCCTMTVSINVFVAEWLCLPPAGSSLGLRPNEQSQTGSSLRFNFWKSSRSSIRKESWYPNLCWVLNPECVKYRKNPLSSVLLKLSFNEKRLDRPGHKRSSVGTLP